jgi:hypothetical protein
VTVARIPEPDLARLPTLRMTVGIRRGQAMALSTHADELRDESAALRAQATLVLRRAVELRAASQRTRTAALDL